VNVRHVEREECVRVCENSEKRKGTTIRRRRGAKKNLQGEGTSEYMDLQYSGSPLGLVVPVTDKRTGSARI
jgi:hypothetical protein